MKCKFCGCTERRACQIAYTALAEDDIVGRATAFARTGELISFMDLCHWIGPNICSAPACVEKAYAERCAEIDRLIGMAA
jgi:hypothetical protein